MTATATRVLLVGGHESDGGADLDRYRTVLPCARAVRPGRPLHESATEALSDGGTVVVVPMTFGRDPAMVADAARTLQWIATHHDGPLPLALAPPFGVADHLTARLRAAAGAVGSRDPSAALVVAARAGDPSDDAELHRIAHLVRVHGAGVEVEVATLAADADIAPVLDRLRRLGHERSVVVPGGFGAGLDVDPAAPAFAGMTHGGPLMAEAAVGRIVTERVDTALHDLRHGHDGVAAGLAADHDHDHDHGFAHAHDHPHSHAGPHDHDDHAHDQEGSNRWSAGSPPTTTAATTSRSTPVAPR